LAAIGVEILLGACEHYRETDISRVFIETIKTPLKFWSRIDSAEGKRE
jgi:hypothetical protein